MPENNQFRCVDCGFCGPVAWECNQRTHPRCNACANRAGFLRGSAVSSLARLTEEIDRSIDSEEAELERCGDCENYLDDCECSSYFEERLYSEENLPQYQSRSQGKYIKSTRIFSAEIECYYRHGGALKVLDSIPEGIGATRDGSLESRGIEFQTPKLKGGQGEKQLRALCETLRDHKFYVDRTTGLHIHLDGRGLLTRDPRNGEPTALKQLWYFYSAFDDVLLSFLPKSRRTNRFCRPTKETARLSAIAAARTVRDLEEIWYRETSPHSINYRKDHKYDDSRYAGLNLHSLFSSKHVEIRFHGGTLNAVKILEWTHLHQTILDLAAKRQLPTERTNEARALSLASQTQLFFNMLGLPEHSRKYFLQRQKTFAESLKNEDGEMENITDATNSVSVIA